jgi:hypothetical protein
MPAYNHGCYLASGMILVCFIIFLACQLRHEYEHNVRCWEYPMSCMSVLLQDFREHLR